jgi:hypothetical protein
MVKMIHELGTIVREHVGKLYREQKLNEVKELFGGLTRMAEDTLEDFVEQDMENIVQLFRVFNEGTHGSAGTFTFDQLHPTRKRVEDGIMFLTEIIGNV